MLRKPLQTEIRILQASVTKSANWNCFLSHRLDERQTLYTINFTKICQQYFLYSKWTMWNTIICETRTKIEAFNSNGWFCNFYPNLPKSSLNKVKNKAHTWIEHLLNTRNENCKWNRPFCNFNQVNPKPFSISKWAKLKLAK